MTNGGGHSNALFKGDKKLHVNWRCIVFRAEADTAQLVISERTGGATTAVAINGVQVQPFLAP